MTPGCGTESETAQCFTETGQSLRDDRYVVRLANNTLTPVSWCVLCANVIVEKKHPETGLS